MLHHGKEPFPPIWIDVKEGSDAAKEGKKYEPIAKAQLKRVTKLWAQEVTKAQKRAKAENMSKVLKLRSYTAQHSCCVFGAANHDEICCTP